MDEVIMNDRMLRILKLLWLPILLLLLIVIEPYTGISKTPYKWAYLGIQVVLFIAYTYILFKDRPKYMPANRKLKGKHEQRPK
jgi:hypothetical protein